MDADVESVDHVLIFLTALKKVNDMDFEWGNHKPAKKEPSADIRSVADITRQAYVALVDEGFSKTEAMTITLEFVRASVMSGVQKDNGNGNDG